MEIRLSTSDGVPVYRQIVNQVKYLVASGRLRPGQELPTIRALAEKLVINPNTVVHAYAELENEGLVVRRHGSGTYVAEDPTRLSSHAGREALSAKVDSLLADAAHLNTSVEEVIRLVCERYASLKKREPS
jgi:GntR family transcriptional regulator